MGKKHYIINMSLALLMPIVVLGGCLMNGLVAEETNTGGVHVSENPTVPMDFIMPDGLSIPTVEEAEMLLPEPAPPIGWIDGDRRDKPTSYNIELAAEKGLTVPTRFDENYLMLQALYRKALEHYLAGASSLEEFDELLRNHDLNFIRNLPEYESFYQRYSTFGFDFIFLRNNFPIERLEMEDLIALRDCLVNNGDKITDNLLDIVARTYKTVIAAYEKEAIRAAFVDETRIRYSGWGDCYAPNDALVFKVADINEFDENWEFVSIENEEAKTDYLYNVLKPMMEEKLSEELGIMVVVSIERFFS